mgnify:CR=1 FL=1
MQARLKLTGVEVNVEEGNLQQVEQNVELGSKDQVGLRSHFLLSPHNSRLRSAVNSLPNMAKEKVTNTLRSSLEKGENKRQITKLVF